MFFSHAVLKPQITLINDVESLLHSANLSELNSALACTRFVTDYCKLLRSCVLRRNHSTINIIQILLLTVGNGWLVEQGSIWGREAIATQLLHFT